MQESVDPERPSHRRPFELARGPANQLRVAINPDFSERAWGAWFGELQQALEQGVWTTEPITSVHIDFSACRWADPLPLLSLALALADFESPHKSVCLTFPSECKKRSKDYRDAAIDCRKRTAFLKFLAKEGFLELLARKHPVTSPERPTSKGTSMRKVTFGKKEISEDDLRLLGETWAPLIFEESTCLPARLLQLRHPSEEKKKAHIDDDDIDRWVERVLDAQIAPVVAAKVPAWAQRGLKYRLQLLLRETLHNVAQHAYGNQGLAAVYVRYRQGLLGQAPNAWSPLDKYIRREENGSNMALLGTVPRYLGFTRSRSGFFEVYILDAGRGFVNRVTEAEDMKYLLKEVNPFHKAMFAVFKDGYSSKTDRPTAQGGLHLLQQLMEPNKDYLKGRDDDTWWGRSLPLPRTQSDTTPDGSFTIDCGAKLAQTVPIRGLAWTARLSWLDPMDQFTSGVLGTWRGLETEIHRKPLIDTLKRADVDPGALTGIAVHDWRLSGGPWSDVEEFTKASASCLMILPPMNWMKNSIQEHLGKVLGTGCLTPDGTLLLGEIASHEVLPFMAATQRARGLFKGLEQRPRFIVMITRALRACVLERDATGLYQEQVNLTRAFVENQPVGSTQLSLRLTDYHRALRMHDARRLWEAVGVITKPSNSTDKIERLSPNPPTENREHPFFLNEWVDWHGLCLDGYLDFPGTLTHPICRDVYGLNLQRLEALFPRHECRFAPLDNLVESLIVRFRAEQRPTGRSEKHLLKVRIGSVQVSGLTEHLDDGAEPLFHFLRHPSGNAKGHYLLPWLAPLRRQKPTECTDSRNRARGYYERIGRTPAIARDGWKTFRLPHFGPDENPVYEDPPRRSYRTWQDTSRSPMKIGHWSYGGHHDLLTINLLLAFDTELDQISLALAGALGRYIYANLFRVLAIRPTHLNALGKSLRAAIRHDGFRHLLPATIGRDKGLLLFPSHPVTDHVLARLMTWVEDEAKRDDILGRCIPVLPLRRHRGGSGLQLSGLTLERLKSFTSSLDDQSRPPPPIVFFDDAMISGRTFLELKSLLHDLGFQDIYSLTMLDRQRLPASHHVNQAMSRPNGVRDACFWRLDAPALGSPGHCPLCRGLGRVAELAKGLISREMRARAGRWQDIWRERNPATEWGDSGLNPIPVALREARRKFGIVPRDDSPSGYRQAGGKEQQIQLTNSAGLAAWVTELYSVTAQDDLVGRLIVNETLEPEARIQLVSSQLLLFSHEFDGELAEEMGFHLITALREARAHDRNTSLAAVTLLAGRDDFLGRVIQRMIKEAAREQPATITALIRDSNQDFQLVLEFCQLLGIDLGFWVPPRYSESVEIGSSEPSDAPRDRRDTYKRLYDEVQLSYSHSAHLKRLADIPDDPDADTDIASYLRCARTSALNLKDLVTRLDPVWLRPDPIDGVCIRATFADRKKEIDTLANHLFKALDAAESPQRRNTELRTAKQLSRTLLDRATDLCKVLFAPIGKEKMKDGNPSAILTTLRTVANGVPKHSKGISVVTTSGAQNKRAVRPLDKREMSEAYVVWDTDLERSLENLLSNVKHTDGGPTTCPNEWGHMDKEETADQWIHLELEEQYLALLLMQLNSGKSLAKSLEKEMNNKGVLKPITQLGGKITYQDQENWTLIKIRIPYAHTLLDTPAGERS